MKTTAKTPLWAALALGAASLATPAFALTYLEDFSGTLANWTAGPSHLDNYGIVGGELYIDGSSGPSGGWGVLMFNPALGSHFTASWTARITAPHYANFVLFADPWAWEVSSGYATHGQLAWLDISEAGGESHFDLWTRTAGNVTALVSEVNVVPDIDVGQTMNWQLSKDGAAIKVWINGQLVADVNDAAYATSNMKLGLSFGEDSQGYFDNLSVNVVPEPATGVLMLLGLAGVGAVARRRLGAA